MENHLDELIDYCDAYFAYANPSLKHNATSWGDGNNYDIAAGNAKKWLLERAHYIYSTLKTYPITSPTDDEDDVHYDDDHPDGIEMVSTDPADRTSLVDVFDLNGRCVKRQVNVFDLRTGLRPGIYIVAGKKMVVK